MEKHVYAVSSSDLVMFINSLSDIMALIRLELNQ